jgi:opacity protein-like surface antigen
MKNIYITLSLILISSSQLFSQILTKEDSLSAGLIKSSSPTVLSSYGNAKYSNNITDGTSSTNVDRLVLFVGHKFNKKIAFFSEIEIEDVKVAGGETGGEVALEQAFIKFDINRNNYFSAGLLIPRIGIINENHLPNTFNGNDRPMVERLVIPATFREVGVAYYGNSNKIVGLNYSIALLNGLNSEEFQASKGIRGGRYEGADANANSLAVTGALLYYKNNIRTQASVYYGGSNTMSKFHSDSLGLTSGVFSVPVQLYEYNIQYKNKGLQLKGLVSFVNIPDAGKLNSLYGNDVAENILGFYAEAAYNLTYKKDKAFILFSRYENIDMTKKTPSNCTANYANNQQYVTSGITFMPHSGVSIKVDYSYRLTGTLHSSLVNPLQVYNPSQHTVNIGLGYSF